MRKTLLALLLLIVTVAVFIGCGGSDETKEAEETTTTGSNVVESPTAKPGRVTSEETSITERYEEPLAPADGYEVINLEKIYMPVWDDKTTLPRLIRTYEEFNALALSDIFQPDADFSFETHSLVVVEFQFVGSEKMVEFYGFDVVDGKVSPIFTVERVDPPTEGIYRRLVLISVRASDIAGEMGEIFVVNLTYPGAGSHYYHSYVHADTMVDETQPLAPTKIGSYIPLGDEAFENWDYTKQAVLVRSWDEFYALKPTKDINNWYYGFSFDHSVMIIAAFTHHSEERITDFYGFDVVDGKICTILMVDTPTDPNAAVPDDIILSYVLITVPPDSIVGELGEVLVVVNGHYGYKSYHHMAYIPKS